MTSGGLPIECAWISVLILFYSALCLSGSVLLVCMLWQYRERQSYVALISMFVNLSTLASIAQQVHYAVDWVQIKQTQYDMDIASHNRQSSSFGGDIQVLDQVLFWTQYYSYNVEALLILFWAVALFQAAWNLDVAWFSTRKAHVAVFSKGFAILFPAIFIGLVYVEAVAKIQWLCFVLINFNISVSLTAGSLLIILILYKYVRTRRVAASSLARSRRWASMSSTSIRHPPSESTNLSSTSVGEEVRGFQNSGSIYDGALIFRFIIGFIVLAAFDVIIIAFQIYSVSENSRISNLSGPDHSVRNTVRDLLSHIPGVSLSLFVFLVFGTTKSISQYRTALFLRCTKSDRRQLPSLRHASAAPRRVQRSTSDTFLGLADAPRHPGNRDRSHADDPEVLRGPASVLSERLFIINNLSHPIPDSIKSPPSSLGNTSPGHHGGWDSGWRANGLSREDDEIELRPTVTWEGSRVLGEKMVVGKDAADPEPLDGIMRAAGVAKSKRWFGIMTHVGKRNNKLNS